MTDSQLRGTQSEDIIAVRFRMEATADEVVARLLESVRRTDLSLVTVYGDGQRVYPFAARDATLAASSWRAELLWGSAAIKPGWQLEVFLRRAETFLELPGGLRLELGGGRRGLREKVMV